MTVVITFDKAEYSLNDERGGRLQKAWKEGSLKKTVDLYGDGKNIIATSSISRIVSDEMREEELHSINQDYKCKYGFWHAKGEKCGHSNKDGRSPQTSKSQLASYKDHTAEWIEILKINSEALKGVPPHHKVGLIKNLSEYKVYKETGKMPKWIDPLEWKPEDGGYQDRIKRSRGPKYDITKNSGA